MRIAAELLLAANTGLEPAPLAAPPRAASCRGSRSRSGWPPGSRRSRDAVLDEVDAGVGGRTARAVGEKLRGWPTRPGDLITHLPQIASLADAHFRVEKRAGDPTATDVERLDGDALIDEFARMLGGDDDDRPPPRQGQ